MTEPVTPTEYAEWNEEQRPYGLMYAHRPRRTLIDRLRRRHPQPCVHLGVRRTTLRVAHSEARAMSEDVDPGVIVLFDLKTHEVVDQWITDPAVKDVRVDLSEAAAR